MENTSSKSEKRVIAIGFFDGVHIGHAALLEKAKKRAAEIGAVPSVLSFDVHPDNLVFGTQIRLIGDARSREELIRRIFGITDTIFIHFNKYTMNMPWQEFAGYVVDELNAAGIVVGHDFTFGAKGEGNSEKLSSWCAGKGIGCDVIPPVTLDGITVSSSYIRTLLEEGKIEEANRFLGHPHCLSDTVHSGYHIGRKLFAPTINMFFPENVIVPRHGVYATRVTLADGSVHDAVTNIGVRPTFSDDGKVSVESHLLDYSGNLYNMPARVDFYSFIRAEQKFPDFDALSKQIEEDTERARNFFLDK